MSRNNLFTVDLSSDEIVLSLFERSLKRISLKDCYSFSVKGYKSKADRSMFISNEIKNFYFKNMKYIKECTLILPRKSALLFFVEFPKAAIENLSNVIDFEIEKYIPFLKKDVVYAHRVMSKTKTSVKVMISAVKKDILSETLNTMERTGIKVEGVEVSTVSLCNGAKVFKGLTGGDALLVDYSEDNLDIIHFRSGEIASSKLITMNQGEDHQSRLADELSAITATMPTKPRVYLIKRGAAAGGGDDVSAIEFDESMVILTGQLNVNRFKLATSICCAAGEFGIGDYNLNFLYREGDEPKSRFGNLLSATLAVFAVLCVGAFLFAQHAVQTRSIDAVNSYLSDYKQKAFDVKALSEEAGGIEKELTMVHSIVKDDRNIQEILKELTLKIPDSAWLRSFEYKDRKFYLKGLAKSASELIYRLEDSDMFENVSIASSIIKRGDGLEEFNIQGEVR